MSTNTQILRTQNALLTSIERQEKYILGMAMDKLGCPACGTKCSQIDASGLALDDFDAKKPANAYTYHCTGCKRELVHEVYFIGLPPHGWGLAAHEREKLKQPVSP